MSCLGHHEERNHNVGGVGGLGVGHGNPHDGQHKGIPGHLPPPPVKHWYDVKNKSILFWIGIMYWIS